MPQSVAFMVVALEAVLSSLLSVDCLGFVLALAGLVDIGFLFEGIVGNLLLLAPTLKLPAMKLMKNGIRGYIHTTARLLARRLRVLAVVPYGFYGVSSSSRLWW